MPREIASSDKTENEAIDLASRNFHPAGGFRDEGLYGDEGPDNLCVYGEAHMNTVVQKMAERIAERHDFPRLDETGRQIWRGRGKPASSIDRSGAAPQTETAPQKDTAQVTVSVLRRWLENGRADQAIARQFDIDIGRVQALRRYYGFSRH